MTTLRWTGGRVVPWVTGIWAAASVQRVPLRGLYHPWMARQGGAKRLGQRGWSPASAKRGVGTFVWRAGYEWLHEWRIAQSNSVGLAGVETRCDAAERHIEQPTPGSR